MPDPESPRVRIAVVDDEKLLLQVFSSLMRQYHYHGDFFSNPLKALDAIVGNPGRYSLVISDIRMPELDGIAFAKKVRLVMPELPIMFMTGDVSDQVRRAALELGNVAFLEKPFPLEATLKEAIPKFLAQQAKK